MLRFFAVTGAFLGGLVLGWIATMLVYLVATTLFGVIDREGGMAMGFAFMIGPFLGVVTGIALAILVALRTGRKASPGAGQ
jgi:hypothetical protein